MSELTGRHVQGVVKTIQDSRGRNTVELTLRCGAFQGVGDVPAGASKGEDEAKTVGIEQALNNIEKVLLPRLQQENVDITDPGAIRRFDQLMASLAGPNFADLGANATLPLSRALWQLGAACRRMPLYRFIRLAAPSIASESRVLFLMNIFNGGLHALKVKDGEQLGRDRIDVQEIMVVPMTAHTYQEALQVGEEIDEALERRLQQQYGAGSITRADEAGFSVKGLGDSKDAIAQVIAAISDAGYVPGTDVKLALDVAASSFIESSGQSYLLTGTSYSSADLIAYWCELVDAYPQIFLSIEDGLGENDWQHWKKLSAEMRKRSVVTVGDDLFVTQMPRLQRGIQELSAHAVLIKVNQNGTVGGTLEVMEAARKAKMQWIVSHRSGETLDDSIADLAYATGALGLKTGDPQPVRAFPAPASWVRRSKYLRMIAMEKLDQQGL